MDHEQPEHLISASNSAVAAGIKSTGSASARNPILAAAAAATGRHSIGSAAHNCTVVDDRREGGIGLLQSRGKGLAKT
jgi:hypothetical protein